VRQEKQQLDRADEESGQDGTVPKEKRLDTANKVIVRLQRAVDHVREQIDE
jgi:hypothetical protein